MNPKLVSIAVASGIAFAGTEALAQSRDAIIVSGTDTVPNAIVVVTRDPAPRPATAPTADTRGPVEPRINPPA